MELFDDLIVQDSHDLDLQAFAQGKDTYPISSDSSDIPGTQTEEAHRDEVQKKIDNEMQKPTVKIEVINTLDIGKKPTKDDIEFSNKPDGLEFEFKEATETDYYGKANITYTIFSDIPGTQKKDKTRKVSDFWNSDVQKVQEKINKAIESPEFIVKTKKSLQPSTEIKDLSGITPHSFSTALNIQILSCQTLEKEDGDKLYANIEYKVSSNKVKGTMPRTTTNKLEIVKY